MIRRLLCGLLLGCVSAISSSQAWQLVWSDEFGPAAHIDASKWRWEIGGGGWGNRELETYTSSTANSTLSSLSGQSFLDIIARRDVSGNFTSARLASNAAFTYGRMMIRAWVPGGLGTWPAIWMLPSTYEYGNHSWPDNGEIDIMEEVGFEGNISHGTVHNHSFNGMLGNQISNSLAVPNMTAGFHIYSLEWRPTQIDIFVDGKSYLSYHRNGADWKAWPYDKPFQFRLNMAVGGTWGGAKGVATNIWPRHFAIDYFRVYKGVSTRYGKSNSIPGKIFASQYDLGGEGFAYHDTTPGNTGGILRNDGVDIGTSPSEGPYIGWIAPDEWVNYSVPVNAAGKYAFTIRVASPNTGKSFYLEVDDAKATEPLIVPNTGDWNKFTTLQMGTLPLTAGNHRFRVVALTDGFNFGNISSTKISGP